MPLPSLSARPHLAALLLACLVVSGLLAGARLVAVHVERHYLRAVAPLSLPLKDQGDCLARELAGAQNVLPLYGSSELVKDLRDKASVRFRCYPTDFAVSPIGKAGTTSLVITQKLAGIGGDLAGRKVAISLSPGWFFSAQLDPQHYSGNFSALHAAEVAFAAPISHRLRKRIAQRMLEFPEPLEKQPVVQFALTRLADDSARSRIEYALCRPLGLVQVGLMRLQDHAHAAFYLWDHRSRLKSHPPNPIDINWDHEVSKWASRAPETPMEPLELRRWMDRWSGDEGFLSALQSSPEWDDLDMLLRALREMHAEPLLVSIPIDGNFFDQIGISARARQAYYDRLNALAHHYRVPVVDFSEHDHDAHFLADHHDHLSVEGWAYFDRELDHFYHNRPPSTTTPRPRRFSKG